MVNNPTDINKTKIYFSLQITEHTIKRPTWDSTAIKDHKKWHWKYRYWLGTGTKMLGL